MTEPDEPRRAIVGKDGPEAIFPLTKEYCYGIRGILARLKRLDEEEGQSDD